MHNYLEEYHNLVDSGEVVVCEKIKQEIAIEKKMFNNVEIRFDIVKASRPLRFIETYCKHHKGDFKGKDFKLEIWQKWMVQSIFGFVWNFDTDEIERQAVALEEELLECEDVFEREHKQIKIIQLRDKIKRNGTRVCSEFMLMIARKNGKTALAAGISLYMLLSDGENSPEVYSVATKQDQASLLYKDSLKMVNQSPDLLKVTKELKQSNTITGLKNDGIFKALSKDHKSQDGLNPSYANFDEVHALRDRNVYDVVVSGMGARKQPLIGMTTTAGHDRGYFFDSQYFYYESILKGVVENLSIRLFIFEQDDAEEINNPVMWRKSNPGLGTINSFSYLSEQVKKALQDPVQKKNVLCKNFNIQVTDNDAFFDEMHCRINPFDEDELFGQYGHIGVDLGPKQDLTIITFLAVSGDLKKPEFRVKQWALFPEATIDEREATDKIPYRQYVDDGVIHLVRGDQVTQHHVREFVEELVKKYKFKVRNAGIDPYRCEELIQLWQDMYGKDFAIATHNQWRKAMSPTIYRLRSHLFNKRVFFNHNLLRVHLASCAADIDKEEMLVLVKLNDNVRIDAAHSLIYAVKAFELFFGVQEQSKEDDEDI